MAAIEKELRDVKAKDRAARGRRRRLDTLSRQLTIYDLVSQGFSFGKIAKQLRTNKITSIKCDWLSAKRNIYGYGDTPDILSKKRLPLLNFNPETHLDSCSQCRSAKTFEQMCQVAKTHVDKDKP
jgi:hypothetical protein